MQQNQVTRKMKPFIPLAREKLERSSVTLTVMFTTEVGRIINPTDTEYISGRDGRVYSGEWAAHEPNGKGVITWPAGERYEGEWKDGYKHGQGSLKYASGDSYIGQ